MNGMEGAVKAFWTKYPEGRLIKNIIGISDTCAVVEVRVYSGRDTDKDSFESNAFQEFTHGNGELQTAQERALYQALADAGIEVDQGYTSETPETECQPAEVPQAKERKPEKKTAQTGYTSETPVEEILKVMSVDDAMKAVVPAGPFKNRPLEVVAVENPKSLQWFVKGYKGPDNIIRAAAQKLLDTAAEGNGSR
ncbi:hypothetical protein H8702_09730 [Massilimaliae timonensis]|uniref:Uncharacterized protein n=1 Tax=Massiliimalia timonensis TaxID=1987501 RepID=A0A8J6TQP1_9FIRM|nr:hypothetical protein [Massiliimalia timonensis]MBC8611379.1 hypothetical protein [Massiliimalia timonensis]